MCLSVVLSPKLGSQKYSSDFQSSLYVLMSVWFSVPLSWRSCARPVIACSACGRMPRVQVPLSGGIICMSVHMSVRPFFRGNFCNFLFVLISSLGVQRVAMHLLVNKFHYWLAGPSSKSRYENLALKYFLVIFHNLTQCHTNPSVMYVHDLLKDT